MLNYWKMLLLSAYIAIFPDLVFWFCQTWFSTITLWVTGHQFQLTRTTTNSSTGTCSTSLILNAKHTMSCINYYFWRQFSYGLIAKLLLNSRNLSLLTSVGRCTRVIIACSFSLSHLSFLLVSSRSLSSCLQSFWQVLPAIFTRRVDKLSPRTAEESWSRAAPLARHTLQLCSSTGSG